ncbi:MAG: hypothetical protein IKH39_06680 [Candidatus Methanomethylophilaceae archaeon]|nr:hypothetical protein [Candidatus Methanomethylophilaceae archaeon]
MQTFVPMVMIWKATMLTGTATALPSTILSQNGSLAVPEHSGERRLAPLPERP